MPFIDGLELASIIRRTMPWVHIIILSGHDEFYYAQKAVSLGVSAYILKPINSDKLLRTLEEVVEKIEKEKQEYENGEGYQKRDEIEKTILREHFLSRLVTGAFPLSDILEQAEQQDINLLARRYIVCRCELRGRGLTYEGIAKIRMISQNLFDKNEDIIWFLKGGDKLVLIIKGNSEEMLQEIAYEAAQMLRHELDRYLAVDEPIGIGSIANRISEISQSYYDAKSVTNSGISLQGSKIIGFGDVKNERISPRINFSSNIPLSEKLRHATVDDIEKIVESYFSTTTDEGEKSFLYRYYLLMDLVVTALRLINDMKEQSQNELQEVDNLKILLEVASKQETSIEFAVDILRTLVEGRECNNVRYGREICRAKEYINENYGDESISLHTVAEEVGFSPNHFSAIFSQEIGETFIEYLTKTRLNAAKSMLLNTRKKLSDIAFDIGYREANYFSYIFKKYVGVSPREFRNNGGK